MVYSFAQTDHECKAFMEHLDNDKDGKISVAEFKAGGFLWMLPPLLPGCFP